MSIPTRLASALVSSDSPDYACSMHSSPMLRFSLELYLSAQRLHLTGQGFDRKLAVLNLAQSVELAVKAALVEENESIYEGGGKTLNTHSARKKLAGLWKDPIPYSARMELLIDERNAMQHRYGDVDEQTLGYHLETVTDFLRSLLNDLFSEDLDDYVHLTDPQLAANCSRFIGPAPVTSVEVPEENSDVQPPAVSRLEDTTSASDPAATLVSKFMSFERTLRERVLAATGTDYEIRSALDVTMKFAANVNALDRELVGRIPGVFALRNAVVHGTLIPSAHQLDSAESVLGKLVIALKSPDNLAELRMAVDASMKGVRGTNLRATPAPDERRPPALSPRPEAEPAEEGE